MPLSNATCGASTPFTKRIILLVTILFVTPSLVSQELKSSSTLGFSVQMLGPSSTLISRSQLVRLLVDGQTRRISFPLSSAATVDGRATSGVELIARFRGENSGGLNGLGARVDGGQLQSFLPNTKRNESVLTLFHKREAGTAGDRVLELEWTTERAESGANLLEIEIRQY